MSYDIKSIEFIYICRMKTIIRKILTGSVVSICTLLVSCSTNKSSIEQCLERAKADYDIRNLSDAMDAAIEVIDQADHSGADSLKAAGLYLAAISQ